MAARAPLGKDEEKRFHQFLRRRQLKGEAVRLLEAAKEEHGLKRNQLRAAKDASYEDIVDSLGEALRHGWVDTAILTKVLDDAEIAGRQHVCLFQPEARLEAKVRSLLLHPTNLVTEDARLEDFWAVPEETYTRLLFQSPSLIVLKIITARKYWVELPGTIRTDDYQKIEKKRAVERAAMIVKFDSGKRLLQFRVPTREQAPGIDTSNSVFGLIVDLVRSQYEDDGLEWLLQLPALEIGDAFQAIVANRDDFQLIADTPENKFFKSSMSKKGSPLLGSDIRDYDEWVYHEGFARASLRGAWTIASDRCVDVRMHYEQVKIDSELKKNVARVYFPQPHSDEEVEHVIQRIRDHI